ncbi:hypothetical protein LTR85_002406 [Meristemomyces frigidus]|nr:hypothetical protein LTR85_002406 [Meristemomyces frigidus]
MHPTTNKTGLLLFFGILLLHITAASSLPMSPEWFRSSRCTLDYGAMVPSITGKLTGLGEDLGVIGHGGSSTVRLVRRRIDGNLSAVKQFPPIAPDSPRREALEECIKLEYHMGKLAGGHAGIAETQELINDPSTGIWWIATTFHNHSLAADIWDLESSGVESASSLSL